MKSPLRTILEKNVVKKNNEPTYFGIGTKHLDVSTMRYSMFGAVWQVQNGYRYIYSYWFCDNKNDLMSHVHCCEWKNLVNSDEEIFDVYQVIRDEQERQLWINRYKLTNNTNEIWDVKKPGWYLIRSSKSFPCTLTCIQKTKRTLWIEHIGICEAENDIKKFINLINLEHHVHLLLGDVIIQ